MKTFLVSIIVNLMVVVGLQASETITISTGEWAPYTSQNDPNGKVAETIVREAFKLEGIDVKYSYDGWKKTFAMAQEAKTDGTIPWFQSPDREANFFYSKKAIIRTKTVFFHLKSSDVKWKTYEDLKKYKIGGTVGFKTAKFLDGKGIKVELSDTELENFQKLLAGTIDITSASFLVGHSIIKKNFPADKAAMFTSHAKKIFPATGAYYLVSKKHPRGQELVDKFDSGMQKLVKSGRYVQIIKESMKK